MEKKTIRGRFAPSPSGRMHMGNAYSALLSWLSVKSKGGEWVLRIEDLDPGRSRKEYADQIEEDLLWLGLEWDEGGSRGGDHGPYYQSMRDDIYHEYLERLRQKGLTYPCYCTRADIMATQAPHETDGRIVYQGTCRGREEQPGVPHATRVIVPDETICYCDGHYGEQHVNLQEHCGDFVLQRRDGAWAYQLAVVVDDALMGITEVVRGVDLLLSAAQQIYLYRELGFDEPAFCHLPLLCAEHEGVVQRLSKRDRSMNLGEIRQHMSAEEVVGFLACHAGIIDQPQKITAAELLPLFSWDRVPCDPIIL